MKARCDQRPVFASRSSRAAKAALWLQGRVSLPAGAGISTLRLLRDLRDHGPMAGARRTGRCAGQGLKHPCPAMGNAMKEGWVKKAHPRYIITVGGREILMLAECVMSEIDRVWQWVETGEGGVPRS